MSAAASQGERFDLETLRPQPWKNGGGQTREIATHPPGAGFDDFEWRLSVADVARDGPFSAFAGIDRTIVLLQGAGMRLLYSGNGVEQLLDRPGAAFAFAGEMPIEAQLVAGATRDFNVMTRRGRWSADVGSLHAPARIEGADAMLLLCGAGHWAVPLGDDIELVPWQGLLWRTPVGPLSVRPRDDAPTPWLLAVRLCHDLPP